MTCLEPFHGLLLDLDFQIEADLSDLVQMFAQIPKGNLNLHLAQ